MKSLYKLANLCGYKKGVSSDDARSTFYNRKKPKRHFKLKVNGTLAINAWRNKKAA